ncbi:SGNH/GDSL hydrolase family protein [Janibacter alkaliphilus]|uniref:Lysophospholipase L1-like esterase n=1 Tax=Janibacter alkaliphilus TaxID=1069963 RepID=A0A852X897_9MICO|nr:lysophospholipase L1-like esterase [Janibacter alkaliphilus]
MTGRTTHPWTRYVAVGDSFTEGMVDPDPARPDAYRGWADLLAAELAERTEAPFGYANLAIRGRKVDDVVGRQLDEALAMGPDLVSIVGGGNDILRPRVDLDRLAATLESAVARARAAGADVLMATPSNPAEAGLFRGLLGRHAIHSANVFSIAQRHAAHVLDLWGLESVRDWRMWGEDRIHLSTEGHHRVAQAALHALGQSTGDGWRDRLDPAPPLPARERAAKGAAWARTYAGPWVQRRVKGISSGDLRDAKRPEITPLGG